MREAAALHEVMRALGRGAVRVFRNTVGACRDERSGQFIHYGLCKGSSDLIGWRTVEVTPDMVGRRLAVFVAVEVKGDGGRVTPEQEQFLQAVRAAGGIGVLARSGDEAVQRVQLPKS